jgi:hypothetical protein
MFTHLIESSSHKRSSSAEAHFFSAHLPRMRCCSQARASPASTLTMRNSENKISIRHRSSCPSRQSYYRATCQWMRHDAATPRKR